MTAVSLNDFIREVECSYDGERYSVRDNGCVLRRPRSTLWITKIRTAEIIALKIFWGKHVWKTRFSKSAIFR